MLMSLGKLNKQAATEQCWFCEKAPAYPDSGATVEMHFGGFLGKTLEYQVKDSVNLSVPRCERCKAVHDRVEGYVAKGGIIGLLIGIAATFSLLYKWDFDSAIDNWKAWLVMIAIFGMIGGTVAWALGRILIPAGIKDQRVREQHPLVRQKVREGWKIGPKPPGL
jgi:hypothetical protein